MPKHTSTFHQDFPQFNFQQGACAPPGPLKIAYDYSSREGEPSERNITCPLGKK